MSSEDKKSRKYDLTHADAATHLRVLADAIEQGHITIREEDLEVNGRVHFKESVKKGKKGTVIKMSIRLECPPEVAAVAEDAPEGEEAVPSNGDGDVEEEEEEEQEHGNDEMAAEDGVSYKSIKKVMKKAFKTMKKQVKSGNVPSPDSVREFCDASLAMTSFAGKGDDMYEEFLADVEAFRIAAEKGDMEILAKQLHSLDHVRKEAHRRFK